uniref:BACK domain-containing protein n=1 Tax=Arion vulgaris TaxID=1028688 RepID=A0A0B7BEI1_9EUPU
MFMKELYCDTRRFCLAHFSELRHSKSFSNLSLSELYDYLSDKCLVVDNEVNVVKAIHKWVSANTCNIHPNTDKYDILKTQIKKLVSTCVLVQGNDGAHDSITEAIFRSGCLQTEQFQGSLAKRTRQEDVFMFWSLLSPTNPDGLVTIAKFSLETGVGVKFDSMTDIVEKPGFNLSSALCVSGPYVYLSGGGPAFGKINWIKQVWMFDMSKPCSRWVTVCDLIEFRRSHAMVIVGKKLYIFGGFGKFRCKNTQLHSLDLVKGEWEALPLTPTHEINPVATTFDNKIFYICKDWMVYSFDTITKVWTGWNQWETVPHRPPVETKPIAIFPVKSGDSDCFAVVAFTDNCIQIPLICLLRGAVKLHTNEENIAKVTNPFTYAGSVAINGKVAVFLTCAKIEENFYGENEINSIHKVMIFDPETNLMNDFLPVQNVKKAQSILAVPYFPTTFKMGALDFK